MKKNIPLAEYLENTFRFATVGTDEQLDIMNVVDACNHNLTTFYLPSHIEQALCVMAQKQGFQPGYSNLFIYPKT